MNNNEFELNSDSNDFLNNNIDEVSFAGIQNNNVHKILIQNSITNLGFVKMFSNHYLDIISVIKNTKILIDITHTNAFNKINSNLITIKDLLEDFEIKNYKPYKQPIILFVNNKEVEIVCPILFKKIDTIIETLSNKTPKEISKCLINAEKEYNYHLLKMRRLEGIILKETKKLVSYGFVY